MKAWDLADVLRAESNGTDLHLTETCLEVRAERADGSLVKIGAVCLTAKPNERRAMVNKIKFGCR